MGIGAQEPGALFRVCSWPLQWYPNLFTGDAHLPFNLGNHEVLFCSVCLVPFHVIAQLHHPLGYPVSSG